MLVTVENHLFSSNFLKTNTFKTFFTEKKKTNQCFILNFYLKLIFLHPTSAEIVLTYMPVQGQMHYT